MATFYVCVRVSYVIEVKKYELSRKWKKNEENEKKNEENRKCFSLKKKERRGYPFLL